MSGTCSTCLHWQREKVIRSWAGPELRHRECDKIERDAFVFAGPRYDYIATRDDFGCNQWEERKKAE